MTQLRCYCGVSLDLITCPSPDEYNFSPYHNGGSPFPSYADIILSNHSLKPEDLAELVNRSIVDDYASSSWSDFYACPECHGLMLFWPNVDRADYFVPSPRSAAESNAGRTCNCSIALNVSNDLSRFLFVSAEDFDLVFRHIKELIVLKRWKASKRLTEAIRQFVASKTHEFSHCKMCERLLFDSPPDGFALEFVRKVPYT